MIENIIFLVIWCEKYSNIINPEAFIDMMEYVNKNLMRKGYISNFIQMSVGKYLIAFE